MMCSTRERGRDRSSRVQSPGSLSFHRSSVLALRSCSHSFVTTLRVSSVCLIMFLVVREPAKTHTHTYNTCPPEPNPPSLDTEARCLCRHVIIIASELVIGERFLVVNNIGSSAGNAHSWRCTGHLVQNMYISARAIARVGVFTCPPEALVMSHLRVLHHPSPSTGLPR